MGNRCVIHKDIEELKKNYKNWDNYSDLKKNMLKQGEELPKFKHQTHHVIPIREKGFEDARKTLDNLGIDINDAENGIFLPSRGASNKYSGKLPEHPDDLHYGPKNEGARKEYKSFIDEQFKRVETKEDGYKALRRIKLKIESGAFTSK